MPTESEKQAFAKRLRLALNRCPETVRGATDLALHFNLRYREGSPISAQTAHKWLSGRSIPAPNKLRTLANWLGVTEHWLHYGPPPQHARREGREPKRETRYPPSSETLTLANRIQALTPHHRYLVEELVTQFYGDDAPPE